MSAPMVVVCPHCQTGNRVPAERTQDDPACGRCGKALLPGHPVVLNDATLERVGQGELPVVVDFWAQWCGPCRMFAPHFEQAAAQLRGTAILAKLDSDANPRSSARHGIRSIPTVLMLRGGREVARQSGAMSLAQLVQWVRGASTQS